MFFPYYLLSSQHWVKAYPLFMRTFVLSGMDWLLSPLTSCSLSGLTPLHDGWGSWWDELISTRCPHFPFWAPVPTLEHCLFVIMHTALTHSLPCSRGHNTYFQIERKTGKSFFGCWYLQLYFYDVLNYKACGPYNFCWQTFCQQIFKFYSFDCN